MNFLNFQLRHGGFPYRDFISQRGQRHSFFWSLWWAWRWVEQHLINDEWWCYLIHGIFHLLDNAASFKGNFTLFLLNVPLIITMEMLSFSELMTNNLSLSLWFSYLSFPFAMETVRHLWSVDFVNFLIMPHFLSISLQGARVAQYCGRSIHTKITSHPSWGKA